MLDDEFYMRKALAEALRAADEDEVPIGAVVVHQDRIIGKGYNQTEKLTDVTAHAEMLAITAASQWLNSKWLQECTLYVTIEPCVMCAGAIQWARIGKVVYGAPEPKFGFSHHTHKLYHGHTTIVTGVLENECAELMKDFFRKKRKDK